MIEDQKNIAKKELLNSLGPSDSGSPTLASRLLKKKQLRDSSPSEQATQGMLSNAQLADADTLDGTIGLGTTTGTARSPDALSSQRIDLTRT